MKRVFTATAGLAAVGLALAALAGDGRGQGYPVPGIGGAASPSGQPYLPTSPPLDLKKIARNSQRPAEWTAPHEDPGMNRDILIAPENGPYAIYVTSYSGPKAPSMARELVGELRGPNYKLPAFVFNYGEEERRKELERVQQERKRRLDQLRQAGLSTDLPIHVPYMRIEVEVGVLIGGYKDFEAARRDLERIKKLPPLDPNRVKLPGVTVGEMPAAPTPRLTKMDNGPPPKIQTVPLNVFLRAIAVRNPSMPQGPHERDKLDLAVLRRLNAGESYSLLNCRKPYTLAVKHFALPTVVEQNTSVGNFWSKFGLGGSKATEHVDAAGQSAHNLADLLRRSRYKWEAYVLHTRYVSIVTVGSYDSPTDPRLVADQRALAEFSQQLVAGDRTPGQTGQPSPVQLFPIAPMEVPH
jgi:hypothetical protein